MMSLNIEVFNVMDNNCVFKYFCDTCIKYPLNKSIVKFAPNFTNIITTIGSHYSVNGNSKCFV